MEDNKKAYSEVIEILKLVDDEKKLEALPMEMLELLKSKSNPEYKPVISKEIPLDEQNLQPETFAILNWITQKYWEDAQENIDIETRQEINAEDKQEINIENIEANEQTNLIEEAKVEMQESVSEDIETGVSNLPVLFDHLKWYEKIKIKIIELFNKIFRKNKSKENQEGNIV